MGFYKLMLTSALLNVTANILLKKGLNLIGGISGDKAKILSDSIKAVSSPLIFLGLVIYGLSFFISLRVLSQKDLSLVYPLFATLVFLFTTIGSFFILKENISIPRIIGMIVMLVGIFIVAKS